MITVPFFAPSIDVKHSAQAIREIINPEMVVVPAAPAEGIIRIEGREVAGHKFAITSFNMGTPRSEGTYQPVNT